MPDLNIGIGSISDNDFESLLNGATPAPTTEQPANETVTEVTPNAVIQQVDSGFVNPLSDSDMSTILDEVPEQGDEPEEQSEETPKGKVEPTDILKNITEFAIENGIWDEFEGREELELNNESFGELFVKQAEKRAYEYAQQFIEETGPYGKAIIDYIQQGGNPDELIDIFKEEQQVQQFDKNSDEGKKAYIEQFYTNVNRLKPNYAKKLVDDLELEGKLDEELTDVDKQYELYYAQERQALKVQQEEKVRKQQQAEEAYRNTISSEIAKRTDLTDKERRELSKAVLVNDQPLEDGNVVNKFYTSLMQVQNNPQEFLDLVQFVTNKESYLKKIQVKEQNKAVENTFNFVKKNAATKRSTGTESVPKQQTTTFKFY